MKKLKTDEISSVFNFGSAYSKRYLRLHLLRKQSDVDGYCVTISKKVARKAVVRNYCKRVLKYIFREFRSSLPAGYMVLQIRKQFSRRDYHDVVDEFREIVATANCHAD